MPQRKDVRWSQLKVGLLTIVSLSVLAITIFLITGQTGFFSESVTLHTFSADAGGLKNGAVVRLAGVDVGNVRRVQLSGGNDPDRAVEIILEVNRPFMKNIRTNSEVVLAAEGLLGEPYLNIVKGPGEAPQIPDGGTLQFRQTAKFAELVSGSSDLLDNLNVLTTSLNSIVGTIDQGKGTVGQLIKDDTLYRRLDTTVNQAQTLVADINSGKGSIGQLLKSDDFYQRVSAATDKFASLADKINNGEGTVSKLLNDPGLYRNADQFINRGNALLDNINQGKGTLGKLATDDQFYRKLDSAVGNTDAVMMGIRNGEGTIGKLFQDPSLYNSLNATSLEVRELLGDFRKDPKKFLTIQLKVF